jgi:hypothetical protein
VKQEARALQVPQEAMTETCALGRTLDQPGMSATTNDRLASVRTTPSCGASVVNG